MSEEATGGKKAKQGRSIEDQILATREKLKDLENQQKEQIRKDRERNQREVLALISAEKLDSVPASKWESAMPKIKLLLIGKSSESIDAGKQEKAADSKKAGEAVNA